MITTIRQVITGITCLALPSLCALTVYAESQSDLLEEIIVTATKRETLLQKTPVAITAFGPEQINDSQIDGARKVQEMVPNLVYNTTGAATNIYMRGIGSDITNSLAEPGVAMYVDGVYIGVTYAQSALYSDLQRIEVLRGPQGTLYGRNSTGGNLNFITKAPGFDPSFKVSALYGDYDRTKVELSGQLGLVEDRLAIRANYVTDQRDEGYRENVFNQKTLEQKDVTGWSFSALYQATDNLSFLLRADGNKQDDNTPAWDYFQTVPNQSGGIVPDANPLLLGGQVEAGAESVNHNDPTRYETEHKGLSLTTTWDVGDLILKSITAARESDQAGVYDGDGSSVSFLPTRNFEDNEQFSQELNLSGLAFDGRMDWIGGLYYFSQESSSAFYFDLPVMQLAFEGGVPGALAFIAGPRLDGSAPAFTVESPFLDFASTQDTTSRAAFIQSSVDITSDIRLLAGVRNTKDKKENLQSVSNNLSFLGISQCFDLELDDEWSETTWKVGGEITPNNDSLGYISVSKGFKSGGFDIGSCADRYNPETVLAYELGYKTILSDQLLINTALYYYDYQDYQARLFVAGASVVENAADTVVKGIEVEFRYHPTTAFTFSGGVAWSDSEFKEFVADDPMTALPDPTDLKGNEILRSPKLTANLALEYVWGLAGGSDLIGRYEASYTDDYYTDVFNHFYAQVDSHTVQNLRAIWRADNQWEVQAFVENLADEEYVENLIPSNSLGGTVGSWAPPRTWGVQFSYQFGAK